MNKETKERANPCALGHTFVGAELFTAEDDGVVVRMAMTTCMECDRVVWLYPSLP